ncbi:MAG: RIP metalloprotease RseP [candidate division Zixibacteria bacterium]|nr:RIP metalloprotease RseP [candidate division Zixibacteria bacterium]
MSIYFEYLAINYGALSLIFVSLGLIIAVHQIGHLCAAKLLSMKVHKFSLGFGPKLFGWSFGGTDYLIHAIPWGASIALAGELSVSESCANPNQFSSRSKLQRLLVILSGSAMNIIMALLIWWIFLFSYGESLPKTNVLSANSALDGFYPHITVGDRIINLSGNKSGYFHHFDDKILRDILTCTFQRDGNLKNTRVRTYHETKDGLYGLKNLELLTNVIISDIVPDSPAGRAGFEIGDQILNISGVNPWSIEDIQRAVRLSKGKEIRVTVSGKEGIRDIEVKPKISSDGVHKIGIALSYVKSSVRYGIGEALVKVLREVRVQLYEIFINTFKPIITSWRSFGLLEQPDTTSQTNGIFHQPIGEHRFSNRISSAVYMLTYISLLIGVLSMMPLPVLDGGLIIWIIIEVIFGREESIADLRRLMPTSMLLLIAATIIVVSMQLPVVLGPAMRIISG